MEFLAIRPGVAATFWNRLVAFGLLGIILEYFGKALLGWVDGLIVNGWIA